MTGPLLIFGANGQVGWELTRRAAARGIAAVALARSDVDITDRSAVAAAIARVRPQLLVNAAAYTAVDRAESEPEQAFAINRDGAARVAAATAAAGLPLVHLSTDYVYDGSKQRPWREDDPVAPLGVYGASKAAGDAGVREACRRHVILRTSWVYGRHGHNFVKTMLRLASERSELRVVADQHGCPTAADAIADAILDIGDALAAEGGDGRWGTYHFCGGGQTTWHGLAQAIVEDSCQATGHRPEVRAIATADYPTPARRPVYSVLDCGLILARFGIEAPPWRTSLRRVLGDLVAQVPAAGETAS